MQVTFWMKNNSFFRSFAFAGCGIAETVCRERNFRFHLTAAAYVLYFARFYRLTAVQWGILILLMGAVLSAELLNTAVEQTVDLSGTEPTPQGKLAKDASAYAVLILAIASVAIGVIFFWNTAVFLEIIRYHLAHPVMMFAVLVSVPAAFYFVFRLEYRSNNK